MKKWGQEWAREHPLHIEDDVFNVLWKSSSRYYRSNHYGIRPNFERILGEMTTLASWLTPTPFGNPILEVIDGGSPVNSLEWLLNPSDEFSARKLILSQQAFLLEKLARHMRDACKTFDRQLPAFLDYTELFRRLRKRFDLGIYNLNYDTVAISAWPEAFRGFDKDGHFDPSNIHQRNQWNFIYHLHGSVHNCITSHRYQIEWKDNLDSEFKDRHDVMPDMAQDFKSVPLTTLIAGGFKLDQLLTDPYQTLYSALVRHAQEADALLIAGYGFGDRHINRALRSRFERPGNSKNIPKVVVLEKSSHKKLQTASLQSHNFWAYQLTHTLKTKFKITRAHMKNELTVAPFIKSSTFEKDQKNCVAIWHSGFCEANQCIDKIYKLL